MAARQRFVWIDGRGLVEVLDQPPRPRVAIISDVPARPFRSMATGKMQDSKSRYRADLKARGYVELGNDLPEIREPEIPSVADDLRQTASELGVSF